jgi:hypothetical protein
MLKQSLALLGPRRVALTPKMESDMSAAIARLLPRASATSVADIDAFITVALISGLAGC